VELNADRLEKGAFLASQKCDFWFGDSSDLWTGVVCIQKHQQCYAS